MGRISKIGRSGGHGMQGVFVFVLLGLFAVMSTLLVLLGAQMYRGTVDRTGLNNNDRVLSAYVRSMVRSGDAADGVAVLDKDGIPVICLKDYDEEEDEVYMTWIYQYGDQLMELYTEEENEFDPEMGDRVCPVGSFAPELQGSLLTVSMTDENGKASVVRVALRAS